MNGHVFDDLAAYALGSLEPQEQQRVSGHLEQCGSCQKELAAYQAVTDQLMLAVPERTPSPDLRARILNQVASQADPILNERVSWIERLKNFLIAPVPAWGLVAALAIIVALIAFNLLGLGGNQTAAANDFRVVRLAGTESAAAATGWIVISRDGQAGTLIVQNLPPLGEAQQYQLWLTKDGERKSGAVFSVDSSGYASNWVYSQEPLSEYRQFGITIEPRGGSPGPTGAKVLGGKL
ncbi:MAG: anti-sigma factor [Anaerolineaceae bacterium]|nr:anti-sigma factor [Anaerolineaceae bacterium]